jgi:hypothetical protein
VKNINMPILLALLVYLLLLLLCRPATAQECKIVVDVTECRNGFCTPAQWWSNGVYVALNRDRTASIVLTAAHNVIPTQGVNVRSVRVDGIPATVLRAAKRDGFDLAVLRVNSGAKAIAVGASNPPAVDDRIYVRGWIQQHAQFVSRWGRVVGSGLAIYESQQGLSGSPIYNEAGELLGVHVGVSGDTRRFQSVLPLDALVRSADASMLVATELQPFRRSHSNVQTTAPPPAEPRTATSEPVDPITAPDAPAAAEPQPTATASVAGDAKPSIADGIKKAGADIAAAAPGFVADAAAAAVEAAPAGPLGLMELVAIASGTGGTGAAAVLGAKFAYGLWTRRRKRKREESESQTVMPPTVPVAKPVSDPRIDAVLAYLKDRESQALTDAELIEKAKGIILRQTVTADGRTEESYWKEGVRLAAVGSPIIGALGGRQVGKAIEDYVARRYAEAAGDTLRS